MEINNKVKLRDISLNITDGVHSTVIDDNNGKYYLLSCKNIKNGRINIGDNERKINEETFLRLTKRTKISKNDVLITTVGTIGEMAIIKDENPNYDFQRSVGIIKPNTEFVIPEYMYYSVKNELPQIETLVKGAVQKCLFISDINEILIDLPPLETQRKIASILSAIDDKIEINNNISNNLQDEIHGIYSNYYESTELPTIQIGNLIEKRSEKLTEDDWKEMNIIDLSIMPRFNVNISEFSPGANFTTNIYKVHKNDLIFGSIRSYFGKAGISPIDGGIAGTVFNFIPKDINNFSMLFAVITSKRFIDITAKLSSGTKMPIINWDTFCKIEIKKSLDGAIEAQFNEQIKPMIDRTVKIMIENKRLAELRDTLLPKLMSGEIDVDKVEL